MCRWIIHDLGRQLHYIIHTSNMNYISLHHNLHCLYRRINDYRLGHLQHLTKNNITNTKEMVYLSLLHIYQEKFKIKWPKTSISIKKTKRALHSSKKKTHGTKPSRNYWYDLLNYIFITFKMIRSSSYHYVFSHIKIK